MGDTINIDWARAQNPPDPATSYANAFQAGLGLAKSAGLARASTLYAQDPQAGIAAANAFDGDSQAATRRVEGPADAGVIRRWAGSLSELERASLRDRADIIGGISQGLAGLPY